MKWHPIAAAAALASCALTAQAQVTLYGIIDAGIERINKVAVAGGGTANITRMLNAGAGMTSRWGMRGTEDLGNGNKALFVLEGGFGVDTGGLGQAGRLFGRQAFVGLSNATWGTLSFGRQYTMLLYSTVDTDVLGPSLYSLGAVDNGILASRADNSIAYRGSWGGIGVGATYSLGRDTASATPPNFGAANCAGESAVDSTKCRNWSAMLRYDQPGWGVISAIEKNHGGYAANELSAGSAATAGGLTASSLTDQRAVYGAYVKFGDIKLTGGLIKRQNEGNATTPRSNLAYMGAVWPVSPSVTVDGEVARLKYKNANDAANYLALRATYAFSKRTATYVTMGRMANKGNLALSASTGQGGSAPLAGTTQTGITVGLRTSF